MTDQSTHNSSNDYMVSSLGGCIVHDVVKILKSDGISLNPHLWRRPTIALMSEAVTRSRYKLHDIPVEFINYFVNDYTKLHRSEIENQPGKNAIVFDITRDLFTGVVQIGDESFIMNAAEAVGIVDGLTKETMNIEKVKSIIGSDLKVYGLNRDRDEFFELWKVYFEKLVEFLRSNFDQIIMLKLFFTDRVIGGEIRPDLSSGVEKANPLLERMYAFAETLNVPMVELEREAYVTGHFVSWGGPSLTHYVSETTTRLADAVLALLKPDTDSDDNFRVQAYKRAADAERHLIWLNQEKARLAKLEKALELEKQRQSETHKALEAEVSQLLKHAKAVSLKMDKLDS